MAYKNREDLYKKQLEHRKKIRSNILEYLKSHPCIKCGETDPVVLDFDHIANKTTEVSKLLGGTWGWKRVLEEIEKCQVLCANCHRRKTYFQFNYWGRSSVGPERGTSNS